MVENYYAKYNLTRSLSHQKRYIINQYNLMEKIYITYLASIKSLERQLGEKLKAGTNLGVKEIEARIDLERKEAQNLEKRLEIVLAHYPSVKDDSKKTFIELTQDEKEHPKLLIYEKTKDLYFMFRYENQISMYERKIIAAKQIEDPVQRDAELARLKAELAEMRPVFDILANTRKRLEYDKQLEHQEYLDSLEADKQARRKEEEHQVKKVLGSDFNPDMSHCKKGGKSYVWGAELYEKPEKLFVGESSYPVKQINQEIYAYRYGAFSYGSIIKSNGKPTYKDNLCEIIGVTKIEKDGTETTNFVIAPLRWISGFSSALVDKQGRIVTQPIKEAAQRRPVLPKRKKTFFERVFEDLGFQNEKVRGRHSTTTNTQSRPVEYHRVLIPEEEKHQVSFDEREFFANIYLSDYLINNATQNNAHYLGTYTDDKFRRRVTFDGLNEDERIDACFFAQNNPGVITKKGIAINKSLTANNIEALFDTLKLKQQRLVATERAKSKVSFKTIPSTSDTSREEF